MFLKTFKIYTQIFDKDVIKDYFTIFPKNLPSYFKTIPPKLFYPLIGKFLESHRTVKSCSGFLNLYKRSMLISSPFDIEIVFDENRKATCVLGKIGTDHSFMKQHPSFQYSQYIPSHVNLDCVLKFSFGWFIDCKDEMFLIHSPTWHHPKLKVTSGIISGHEELNFFINVLNNENHIVIKQGDPLFLITPLTNKNFKLKIQNRKELEFRRRKGDFTFTNIKKYITETVFKKN
jgi:hypothetical protein|tara:strand:+ start:615 stop:1310 length:696 start_codon:yes stop_codon:yes gene_type:complete